MTQFDGGTVRGQGFWSLSVLCTAFFLLEAFSLGQVSRPALELSSTHLDLGTGMVGDHLSGSVLLSNHTDERVAITKIDGGCGCLQSQSAKSVEPGKRTAIQFLATLRATDSRILYPVSIYTDARPDPLHLALTVHRREPPINLDLHRLDLGVMEIGQPRPPSRIKYRVIHAENKAVLAESEHGYVSVLVEPETAASGWLVVEPRPAVRPMVFTDTVRVRQGDAASECYLTVSGQFARQYEVRPETLSYRLGSQNAMQSRNLVVFRAADTADLPPIVRTTAPPGFRFKDQSSGMALSRSRVLTLELAEPRLLRGEKETTASIWLRGQEAPLQVHIVFTDSN